MLPSAKTAATYEPTKTSTAAEDTDSEVEAESYDEPKVYNLRRGRGRPPIHIPDSTAATTPPPSKRLRSSKRGRSPSPEHARGRSPLPKSQLVASTPGRVKRRRRGEPSPDAQYPSQGSLPMFRGTFQLDPRGWDWWASRGVDGPDASTSDAGKFVAEEADTVKHDHSPAVPSQEVYMAVDVQTTTSALQSPFDDGARAVGEYSTALSVPPLSRSVPMSFPDHSRSSPRPAIPTSNFAINGHPDATATHRSDVYFLHSSQELGPPLYPSPFVDTAQHAPYVPGPTFRSESHHVLPSASMTYNHLTYIPTHQQSLFLAGPGFPGLPYSSLQYNPRATSAMPFDQQNVPAQPQVDGEQPAEVEVAAEERVSGMTAASTHNFDDHVQEIERRNSFHGHLDAGLSNFSSALLSTS